MKVILIVIFCFAITTVNCQSLKPSKVFASSCYNKHDCFAYNDNSGSFIFFNQESHEFIVIVDFKKLKIGNDSLDEWLNDLSETKLIFKGILNTDNLLSLTQHNSKAIIVNGEIAFNGVKKNHSLELIMFEVTEQGMLYTNNGQDNFDRIKTNFQIAINPKDFLIHKKAHHLKKTINLFVYNGNVNKVIPEFYHLLNEK